MTNNRIYYKLNVDGATETQLKLFIKDRKDIRQAWFDFAEKFGAKELLCSDYLRGIKFDSHKAPMGWSSNKNLPGGFYKPARRKVCMDDYKEFKSMSRLPGGLDLSRQLGVDVVITGRAVHFPSYELVGNELLLSLHKNSNDIPEDVTVLKMSEYWGMKEAEQAA